VSHLLLHLYPLMVSINSNRRLQRCVSSLHSWFLYKSLVLNSTKTEVICFGTSKRLQSLSNLTSIEVAGASDPLVDSVKLLGVTYDSHLNFDKHIFNVCVLHPTSISILSAIFALFLTQQLPRLSPVLLLVPDYVMSIIF